MAEPSSNIFIGSSREAQRQIDDRFIKALELILDPSHYEIIPWWNTVWQNLETALKTLEEATDKFDYAIFLLTPGDKINLRGTNFFIARDNVIFEFGLFLSSLGKNRTFCAIPELRNFPHDFRLLTDLGKPIASMYTCEHTPSGEYVCDFSDAAKDIGNRIVNVVCTRTKLHSTKNAAQKNLRSSLRKLEAGINDLEEEVLLTRE